MIWSFFLAVTWASVIAVGVGPLPPTPAPALAPVPPVPSPPVPAPSPSVPVPSPPRAPPDARAQPPLARPSARAVRASSPVTLDGKLTERAWASTPATSAFNQFYPQEGAPPTEPTIVRFVFDDEALYVGIDCVQRLTPIANQRTRRDRVAPADRVIVDISSRGDNVTAFHFGVSAAGVLDDGVFFDDSEFSADWDENWQAVTALRAGGWSVELRIPFRILRFEAASEQPWRLQIQRYTELRHETDLWAWRPRSAPGYVSTFGMLEGLAGVRPPRAIELRFSQLLKLRFRDVEARGPFARAHDLDWPFQIDGKAHPTQGSTLDFTINPDFGQVEADQVILNLSNYELFFPEKRAFFLDGQENWVTPRQVLYTRRIGGRPADPVIDETAVDPTVVGSPPRERLVDAVGPSRIWAAAKVVGTATPQSTAALMSALTGENTALVRREDGMPTLERPVDPLSIYNVLRARRRFGFGGDLGVLATATNRFEHPGDYARLGFRCPGQAASAAAPTPGARCFSDAYVAALDGRWRSPLANYVVTGQLVGSMLSRGPARPQRDGIAILPDHPDWGGSVTAAKRGGAHWLATVTEEVSGRQLDYNDLGYLARKNDSFTYAELTYRTLDPWLATTDTATALAISHRQALDGIRLEDHLRLSFYATFLNFWAASLNTYLHAPYFDDRETGDGTALEHAGVVGADLYVASDSRRLVTGAIWILAWKLTDGVQYQGSATVTVRPSPWVDLELTPAALYSDGEPRFIEKAADLPVYYFGKQKATNVSMTVRATAGLLPTLTLQFYSQLFLATKAFTTPTQFSTAPGAFRTEVAIADLQPRTAAWVAPNTQKAVLNVNAVLRWEYRFGSMLYLVYTRAQEPVIAVPIGQNPRLDAGPLSGQRGATDTFMLKASFWWG